MSYQLQQIFSNPPVIVEDWKNICIVGRVWGGGHGGVAGEERVEAVHHGQQVGQLQGQVYDFIIKSN